MRSPTKKFSALYGGHPLHLLGTVAACALAGYAVIVLGPHALWNPRVWWQSIAVWFLAAIIAHDLVLFPLYALADRSLVKAFAAVRNRRPTRASAISALNYVRVPTLAAGLSLLLFFPGIIRQGQAGYFAATGLTQQPFLARWLLLVGTAYGVSGLVYAVRVGASRKSLA